MATRPMNPLTAQDVSAIRAAHRRMHRAFLAGATRHPQELVQLSSGQYTSVQYWPGDPSAYVWVRGERWRVAGRPTKIGAKRTGGDPKTAIRKKVPSRKVANPDWAAVRAKAAHHGTRAWEATKSTARRAGATAKRGTKKAAPHVARGFRSLSARLDRYAENPSASACTCQKPKRKRSR